MNITERIRKTIDDKNLAQCKVAKAAGFDPKLFSAMLCGRKAIRIEYVPSICRALGITPNELFEL